MHHNLIILYCYRSESLVRSPEGLKLGVDESPLSLGPIGVTEYPPWRREVMRMGKELLDPLRRREI